MGDYILRCVDRSVSLKHWRPKGSKNGVITKHVGIYYIPKGIRGKVSEMKKMRKMDADELDEYLTKKRKEKDAAKDVSKAKKGEKLSRLSDEELNDVMQRTNKEKVTYNNLKQIREHEGESEKKDTKTTQDLVGAAKGLNETLGNINRNYQKNPPTKKQKTEDLSDKSDAELRRMIERTKLEQQYNEVVNKPEVDTGKLKVAAALSAIGTAAVVGTQVVNFVATAKKLK